MRVKCIKCNHEWKPKGINNIKKCHKCKTKYWDKPKDRKERQDRKERKPNKPQSVEYRSWAGMIQRCTNSKNPKYHCYGGRGITICDRWRNSFSDFLSDMGQKPTILHTLDRINNELGYSPDNCKWSTRLEQLRNRRISKLDLEKVKKIRRDFKSGIRQIDISRELGIKKDLVWKVIKNIIWKDIE